MPDKKDSDITLLKDGDISDERYEHAIKVWHEFEMENMEDYKDLYLKTYVFC